MQCSFYTTPLPAVKVCGETVSLTVGRFLNHHALSVLTFPKSSKLLQKHPNASVLVVCVVVSVSVSGECCNMPKRWPLSDRRGSG